MVSGRKREFDKQSALNSAMEVFWQKGYVGASLSDLTQSMGINKPSMYSAFGNKEALFIEATQHYIATKAQSHLTLLKEKDTPLKQRLKNYMMSIVAAQCDSTTPRGCYLVLCQSEMIGGEIPKQACDILTEADNASFTMLTELFNSDPEAKQLNLFGDAQSQALSLLTTLKGTASVGRSGKAFDSLEYVIDSSLRGIGFK